MTLKFVVLFLAACASCMVQVQAGETQQERDEQHREKIVPALTFIANAESVIVYEGGHRRGDARVQELPEEGTFEHASYRFHKEALDLPTSQKRKLMRILSNEHSYDTYGGGKMCGGFNPDVMIEFKTGSETYTVMLCFGCAEARISHGREVLFTELKAYNRLRNLLTKYYRPRSEEAVAEIVDKP